MSQKQTPGVDTPFYSFDSFAQDDTSWPYVRVLKTWFVKTDEGMSKEIEDFMIVECETWDEAYALELVLTTTLLSEGVEVAMNQVMQMAREDWPQFIGPLFHRTDAPADTFTIS